MYISIPFTIPTTVSVERLDFSQTVSKETRATKVQQMQSIQLAGRELNPTLIPSMLRYYDELEGRLDTRAKKDDLEELLNVERMASRAVTHIPTALFQTTYKAIVTYANETYDPTQKDESEHTCGGMLALLGDWSEPGMSTPYLCTSGEYDPQVKAMPDPHLGSDPFPDRISVLDPSVPGLTELLQVYKQDPHSNGNDRAIFINHRDGEVMSTRTNVERASEHTLEKTVGDEPNGYTGNNRFGAARYFSHQNPDAIAIMISGSKAQVYVVQNGRVKIMYDVPSGQEIIHEELSLAETPLH